MLPWKPSLIRGLESRIRRWICDVISCPLLPSAIVTSLQARNKTRMCWCQTVCEGWVCSPSTRRRESLTASSNVPTASRISLLRLSRLSRQRNKRQSHLSRSALFRRQIKCQFLFGDGRPRAEHITRGLEYVQRCLQAPFFPPHSWIFSVLAVNCNFLIQLSQKVWL